MTLIIPKQTILYTPMLATFGGGSSKGFSAGGGVEPAEVLFTTVASHSWTVPAGVTSVCAVCVGGGGGGMRNSLSGNPTVGGDSYFINATTVKGGGGGRGSNSWSGNEGAISSNGVGAGGTYVGDGGGNGGNSRIPRSDIYANFYSGGGAGGYSGNGGDGGGSNGYGQGQVASQAGQGGGGSGGAWFGGGGVGVYGQGTSGAGDTASPVSYTYRGQGGSGGSNAGTTPNSGASGYGQSGGNLAYMGGLYGGGGGGTYAVCGGGGGLGWKNNISVTPGSSYTVVVGAAGAPNQGTSSNNAGYGGQGVVRILWGAGRAFPTTSVDQASSTGGQTVV